MEKLKIFISGTQDDMKPERDAVDRAVNSSSLSTGVRAETAVSQLRAELDAYYARLYGLTRDELRYILDPKEVHGEDFPGETFRVLKEKEVKQFRYAPRDFPVWYIIHINSKIYTHRKERQNAN